MKRIYCHTNLDLYAELWPNELPEIPRVGDEIESSRTHSHQTVYKFKLSLKVVEVRWKANPQGGYYPEIELHDKMNRSIKEFYEWYAPLVGKEVSYFIFHNIMEDKICPHCGGCPIIKEGHNYYCPYCERYS